MSKRKPRHIRLLSGNPGGRPIPAEGPKPDPIRPRCPSWLPAKAKAEWRRVAPGLEKLGLLTQLDRTALECYCVSYARWVEAEAVIAELGSTYKTSSGEIRSRPEVSIARDAVKQTIAWAAEFGMTPDSRGKVDLPPDEDDDARADFFGEK